jgi:hypothetical protein
MMKTLRVPASGPRPSVLTAAAWLAFVGDSIGLFQLDSAVGLESERLGAALAVVGTAVVGAELVDGTAAAVVRPVACAVGAGAAVGTAGAGSTEGWAGATGCVGAGTGGFFAGGGAGEGSAVGVGEPVAHGCVGRHSRPA